MQVVIVTSARSKKHCIVAPVSDIISQSISVFPRSVHGPSWTLERRHPCRKLFRKLYKTDNTQPHSSKSAFKSYSLTTDNCRIREPKPHSRNTATMSGKVVTVTSASHFSQLLSQSTYTVVDFHAVWCGPCKSTSNTPCSTRRETGADSRTAIAPVFQSLAEKETKPGKLQFVKVDVDEQQEVARKYGVSA